MRATHRILGSSLILAGLIGAAPAHADITKCIDKLGRISYSDGSCGNAVLVGYVDVDAPQSLSNPAAAENTPSPPAPRSPMALENTPVRQTPWASMAVAPRQLSTDTATIRAAREALAATDHGLAALRTQKVLATR